MLGDRLPKAGEPDPDRPWPEFAEFNCFDCHHALGAAGRPTPAAGGKRGRTGWHRGWELRRLAGPGDPADAFLTEMTRLSPSVEVLSAAVPALDKALTSPPTAPGELLTWLRPGGDDLKQMNWDGAGWLYHGLVAVELSRREASDRGQDEMDRRFADLAGA